MGSLAMQRGRAVYAWKKALLDAKVRASKLACKDSFNHRSSSFGCDTQVVHDWRPLKETQLLVSRAARAAKIAEAQIMLVPPARFICNPNGDGVPIRLQKMPLYPIAMSKHFLGPRIHSDDGKYHLHRVMQDVYESVKREAECNGELLPSFFADCASGAAVVRTYERLGGLHYYLPGLCFLQNRGVREDSYVVIDAYIRRKLQLDEVFSYMCLPMYQMKDSIYTVKKPALLTSGSTMVAIPEAAFHAGINAGYTIITKQVEEMSLAPNMSQEWLGRKGFDAGVHVDPKFGGDAAVKVAVEIDRRVLGLGNLIFFDAQEVAEDLEKVWERLQALGKDVTGCLLGLQIVKARPGANVYIMLPDFFKLHEDVPLTWE